MPKKKTKKRKQKQENEKRERGREKIPLPTSVMRSRMENDDDGIKSHRYFPPFTPPLLRLSNNLEFECSDGIMRESNNSRVMYEHE